MNEPESWMLLAAQKIDDYFASGDRQIETVYERTMGIKDIVSRHYHQAHPPAPVGYNWIDRLAKDIENMLPNVNMGTVTINQLKMILARAYSKGVLDAAPQPAPAEVESGGLKAEEIPDQCPKCKLSGLWHHDVGYYGGTPTCVKCGYSLATRPIGGEAWPKLEALISFLLNRTDAQDHVENKDRIRDIIAAARLEHETLKEKATPGIHLATVSAILNGYLDPEKLLAGDLECVAVQDAVMAVKELEKLRENNV